MAKLFLPYYPAPTNSNAANYNFDQNGTEGTNTWGLRLDDVIGPHDSVYATLNYSKDTIVSPYYSPCNGPYLPGFGCFSGLTTQLYGGGYTHNFTPNVINIVRAGFQRLNQPRTPLSIGIKFDQQYGIPAFNDPTVPARRWAAFPPPPLPVIRQSAAPTTCLSSVQTIPSTTLTRCSGTSANTAQVWRGIHAFETNQLFVSDVAGVFSFTGTVTGNAVADTLLGLPATAADDPTSPRIHSRASYGAVYLETSTR